MGVSTVDGTIEEALVRRTRPKMSLYSRVTFRLRDGGTKSVEKAIVDPKVAELLKPGASGRFYLYSAIDHRGIHGVRDDQGRTAHGVVRTNETLMLALVVINLVLTIGWLAIAGELPFLSPLLLLLLVPAYFHYRSVRLQAEKQFAADSYAPPAGS